MPAHKSPSWTTAELALLRAHYVESGMPAALEALPGRSLYAIRRKAGLLGLRSPVRQPARPYQLRGEDLERAIALRNDGWSFARIGAEFGISDTAASNAFHTATCAANGFRPAKRNPSGKLEPEEIERMRYMLKKGMRSIEIQRRMAVSHACVAGYRKSYNAELVAARKAPLPPAGNGERYCGVRLTRADRKKVEQHLLTGLGTTKVAAATGISNTSVVEIRARLVRRLKAKGQALPGCDINGRRHTVFAQATAIPEETKQRFFGMLLARVPASRAAIKCGIGVCSGYRLRDQLRADLEGRGEILPPPKRPTRLTDSQRRIRDAECLPREHSRRLRALVHALGEEAGRRELARQLRTENAGPLSFEEQLARVAAGARLVSNVMPTKALPEITLGGVATGAL